jgi:hypothetical protein
MCPVPIFISAIIVFTHLYTQTNSKTQELLESNAGILSRKYIEYLTEELYTKRSDLSEFNICQYHVPILLHL